MPRGHMGRGTGQKVVEDGPQGVDVRARAQAVQLAPGLLRRHVADGAEHGSRARGELGAGAGSAGGPGAVRGSGRRRGGSALGIPALRGPLRRRNRAAAPFGGAPRIVLIGLHLQQGVSPPQYPRQAPIHDVRFAEASHHDVGGLEVPVQHAPRVGEGHGVADLDQDRNDARQGPVLLAQVQQAEDLAQISAAHPGHGEVGIALVVHAHLVGGDDGRVLQAAGDARLIEKAGKRPLASFCQGPGGATGTRLAAGLEAAAIAGGSAAASGGGVHDLHGQGAPEILVPDLQDAPHAAAVDLALHAIAPVRGTVFAQAFEELPGVHLAPFPQELLLPFPTLLFDQPGQPGPVVVHSEQGRSISRVGRAEVLDAQGLPGLDAIQELEESLLSGRGRLRRLPGLFFGWLGLRRP